MYTYLTLEKVSKKLLYSTFLETFQGFPIVSKADIEDFYALLERNTFDPGISVGAFNGNAPALQFYQTQEFVVKNVVSTAIATRAGTEQVLQYEIVAHLYENPFIL